MGHAFFIARPDRDMVEWLIENVSSYQADPMIYTLGSGVQIGLDIRIKTLFDATLFKLRWHDSGLILHEEHTDKYRYDGDQNK